jgi:hypothetical protein
MALLRGELLPGAARSSEDPVSAPYSEQLFGRTVMRGRQEPRERMMADDEAEALLPEAQAFLEKEWRQARLDDLGMPVAKIRPKYGSQLDPRVTHNALCEITIKGRLYGLAWPIEGDRWRYAFECLVRQFTLPFPITMDLERGGFEYGKNFRERVAEELAS